MEIVAQKHVACGDFPVVIAVVYINPKGFAFIAAAEANALISGLEKLQISQPQGGVVFPKLTQIPEMAEKLLVFSSPRVGAAVEGVVVALHARFVPVVNTGRAGQGVLEEGCHEQPLYGFVVLGTGQLPFGFCLPAAVEIVYQGGEDPGAVMSAQEVHIA